jgi:hypothetical protein
VTQSEIEDALNFSIELNCPYEERESNENDLDDIHEISSKLNSILTNEDQSSTDDEQTLSTNKNDLNDKTSDLYDQTIETTSTNFEVEQFEESK